MSYHSPYLLDIDRHALEYDFITEVSPLVWKVLDRKNRVEWLAHEMTFDLWGKDKNHTPTAFRRLMADSERIYKPMLTILSHDCLVRFKDWVTVKGPQVGGIFEYRTYAVWDYCDAGNLGNLLVPPPIHTQTKHTRYPEDDSAEVKLDSNGNPVARPKPHFLPESFCWHVLLSVMKALAWLHNGSWEMAIGERGEFMMLPELDWQPILHRNITPENIFLQHPEATEWYGPCKLGNYGNLYISGHHNDPTKEGFSKPLVPHKMKSFTAMDDLATRDRDQGYIYPEQPDQPYTLISELRALGEIIQLMMVGLGFDITRIRSHTVFENLDHTGYSVELKNMVALLMTFNPDEKTQDGKYMDKDRDCFTSILCILAHHSFRDWKTSDDPEAKKATFREDAMTKSRSDGRVLQIAEGMRNDIMRKVREKDDRFEWKNPQVKPRPTGHLPIANTSTEPFRLPSDIVAETEDGKEMTLEEIQDYLENEL